MSVRKRHIRFVRKRMNFRARAMGRPSMKRFGRGQFSKVPVTGGYSQCMFGNSQKRIVTSIHVKLRGGVLIRPFCFGPLVCPLTQQSFRTLSVAERPRWMPFSFRRNTTCAAGNFKEEVHTTQHHSQSALD